MRKSLIGSSLSLVALALVASAAVAAPKHHKHYVKHHKVTMHHAKAAAHSLPSYVAENGLIGIHLFDSSEHVISVYGSPDDIQPLTFGSTGGGGGFSGGGSGFGGAPTGPGGVGARPGGAGMPGRPGGGGKRSDDEDGPGVGISGSEFDFGDSFLQKLGPGGMAGRPAGGPAGAMPGRPGGPGMMGPGAPGGAMGRGGPGGPGAAAGGGGAPIGGGAAESVTYTRWIYNRENNKFAFVVNRLGQVIQIEAIGLSNPKVKTRRGIGFGSQFASIIQAYHNPDGYDIAGDNILVKYLVRNKVAFRLSRLMEKKPEQVTGIIVSAGKG